jgi:alpha-D-ribose 1-methylphosphonate 5-triphosphate synthase subunit PhnH
MSAALKLGFGRPVQDSQAVFRSVMMAMARPGSIRETSVILDPPGAMAPAAAALALALCDFETPVWLDGPLSADSEVAAYLRFHTGAPLVTSPASAHFAFFASASEITSFETFALGTLDYPDRSTTLIVEVESLGGDAGWRLTGPGIAGETRLAAGPLPPDFAGRLVENRGLFPRGVDLIFVSGDRLAALPRTTLVEA